MAASTTPAELRELTNEELTLRVREAKEELFNLRFQMATGQMDNNRRLRTVRHDIARIYTVMRERAHGLSISPAELETTEGAASCARQAKRVLRPRYSSTERSGGASSGMAR